MGQVGKAIACRHDLDLPEMVDLRGFGTGYPFSYRINGHTADAGKDRPVDLGE